MTLLVDSNVWVAAQDDEDPDFEVCSTLLVERAGTLIASVPVIAETAWFIEDRHGPAAEAEFLVGRQWGGPPIGVIAGDWDRVSELVEVYALLGLGTVEASVIAVAERLELTEIATMNGRDFRVVRPSRWSQKVSPPPDLPSMAGFTTCQSPCSSRSAAQNTRPRLSIHWNIGLVLTGGTVRGVVAGQFGCGYDPECQAASDVPIPSTTDTTTQQPEPSSPSTHSSG